MMRDGDALHNQAVLAIKPLPDFMSIPIGEVAKLPATTRSNWRWLMNLGLVLRPFW
jgi:hypothetical protein